MSKSFILLWMLFNHVLDDYHLQVILANMKQKEWWEHNAPHSRYRHDYIVALLIHSISWAFLIMLPIAAWKGFAVDVCFELALMFNVAIHTIVDDLKANRHRIGLVADQGFHMIQIIITYMMFVT